MTPEEAAVEEVEEAEAEIEASEGGQSEEEEPLDSQDLQPEVSEGETPAVEAEGEEGLEEDASAVEEETLDPGLDEEDQPAFEACPWCRENLPERGGVKFCPFCGSNVQLVPCPACGEELELNWRFCIACGTEVDS